MKKVGRKGVWWVVLLGILWCLNSHAVLAEEEDAFQTAQEEAMASFDFSKVDESLRKMFPGERVSFQEVTEFLLSGDMKKAGETLGAFLREQFFYEFWTHKKLLVYLLLITIIAAVFSNFSNAFGNRQASELSFYILYLLLIALCLNGFRLAMESAQTYLTYLTEFMKALCPVYFLAVTAACGSVTSMFFFEVVLFVIFLAELVDPAFFAAGHQCVFDDSDTGELDRRRIFIAIFSAVGKSDLLDAAGDAGVCGRNQCYPGDSGTGSGFSETGNAC